MSDTDYYLLEMDDMIIALENKDEVIEELKAENQRLKELLKECRVYVENCEQFNAYDFEMLKTIDNAIGEKK